MAPESDTSRRASQWQRVTPQDDLPTAEGHGADSEGPTITPNTPSAPELEERAQSVFDTHGLTPAKPPKPGAATRAEVPTPIEADDVELVPAVTMPDAAETFPTAPVTTEIEVVSAPDANPASESIPVSPYLAPYSPKVDQEASQDASDATPPSAPVTGSLRKVPPSVAALLAVGELPAFDDEPAFVPRYEPTPADEEDEEPPADQRTESPLAHATLEESAEPAYTPPVPAPRWQSVNDTPTTAPQPEDQMAAGSNTGTPASAIAPADAAQTSPAAATPEPGTDAPDGGLPTLPPVDGAEGAQDKGSAGSFWTSTAFLAIVGLLVMAGIGYGIYALFFKPADVVLPAQTVVSAPAEPTASPVAFTDPTDFLAAMPTTVGAYVLTDYTSQSAVASDADATDADATADEELPEGVAEQVTLTYSDGTDQIVVSAWQSYTVEDAQQVFDGLNVDGTDQQPVTVDGQDVGTQVYIGSDAGPTVLWSNNTTVFSATGDNDSVYTFVYGFGF
ncbi:hypothetical protein [Demequina aurantiaca]|uniref:hypothetical protein n=1 Tax=Demequina aurantiaca TaxID=676200 RepID=UPI003D33B46D